MFASKQNSKTKPVLSVLDQAIQALVSQAGGNLARELLCRAAQFLPAQAHALYLPDEQAQHLQLAAVRPDPAPPDLVPERLSIEGSLAGHAFRAGRAASSHDLPSADSSWPDLHAFHMPLKVGDQCLGVLAFMEPVRTPPSSHDVELLWALARYAAPLLDRWQMQKKLDEQHALLESINRRLAEVERLKRDFISTVTHELRTPLAAVIGYADMLLRDAKGLLPPDQLECLKGIRDNATRQLKLVTDLLDMSQMESHQLRLERQPINLREVAVRAVTTVRPQVLNKSQVLTIEWPDGLPLVSGDADRLYQVLVNLLTNASKFTPPGGRITVTAEVGGDDALTVHVSDTGVGIPPEERALIFERFTRGSDEAIRKQPGLGLGLTIARHLVELHGGRIWVASQIGQGSTFSFTVPLYYPGWTRAPQHALVLWAETEVSSWNEALLEWSVERLKAGERWGYILRADRAAGLQVALSRHGLSLPDLMDENQVVLMLDRTSYQTGGYADLDKLTEAVRRFLLKAVQDGCPGAGVGVDMAWLFHGERRLGRLLEQETRLAELLHEFQGPFGLWCGYQGELLTGPILDALRTRHSIIFE